MRAQRLVRIAAVALLALPLATEVEAVEPGLVVVSVDGPAPQSKPVPHLPAGFLQPGQVLGDGAEYLMLPESSVVLVDDRAGRIFRVRGPNRFWIRAGNVGAYEAGRLTRLAPAAFADPRAAVAAAARWLRDQAWVELALRYDLSGTDIPLSSLCTGSFFVRQKPPEVGHPGGFGRYKQPFAPAFSYESHRALGDGLIEVKVHIAIDQGEGMVQRGYDTFRMRRSAEGLRFLPKTPDAQAPDPPLEPVPAGSGPGTLR